MGGTALGVVGMSRAVPHTRGRKWHTTVMGIFNKPVTKAAISVPSVQAAVGYAPAGISKNPIDNFYNYQEGAARQRAMTIATVSRSRDLLASVIGCMPLKMYGEVFDDASGEMEEVPLAPRSWLRQPDPAVTYNFNLK